MAPAAPSLCLLAFACLQLAAATGVQHLDASSFHKAIDTNDATLVMFYAPWCPHCKDAEPKFMSAAKEVGKEPGKVLGMVNCEDAKAKDLCTKQKIEGYPTFKFFSKGQLIQDYEDDQSEKAFIDFMKNPPKEGEKRPPASGGAGGESEGDSEPDTIMEGVTYLGAGNYTEILEKNSFVLVFFYAPWCPHCKDSKPKYQQAAKQLQEKPVSGHVMAAMNCDNKENQKICEEEKVEGYPTVRLMKKRELWAEFEEELEPKPLLEFIRNPPKEKVPPTPVEDEKKGESEKEDTAEKPEDKMKNVEYLEGEQFASLKERPLALVMFYAPWCPHCVQAKPAFDSAAERLKQAGDAGSVLAAVNCDAKPNEKVCEDNKIEGFPTFMLFANGAKKQDYAESPITADGIVQFMQKQKAAGAKDEL